MTTIIKLPRSLDQASFDALFRELAAVSTSSDLLIDAQLTQWASPFGLAALLTVGDSREIVPRFLIPKSHRTTEDWTTCGFFTQAQRVFEMVGDLPSISTANQAAVLLPLTRIAASADVHNVVQTIQTRARNILIDTVKTDASVALRFTTALSEVCQNIVEHSGGGGWVISRAYGSNDSATAGVVRIAVCDSGIGFLKSMEGLQKGSEMQTWDDAVALEEAVMRGASRYKDPGRGQGIAGVRRIIRKLNGAFTVRSGTARIAILPERAGAQDSLLRDLPAFQGAQVEMEIPLSTGATL